MNLINKGYQRITWMQADHAEKKAAGKFDDMTDNKPYAAELWATEVIGTLNAIFPTELEANTFRHPEMLSVANIPTAPRIADTRWLRHR